MTKKGKKTAIFYLLMIVIFGSLMYLITLKGESHQITDELVSAQNTPTNLREGFALFNETLFGQIQSPLGKLLLQIIVILIACRIVGWIFQKMKQPTVIGEILAGIILGPSILGYFFPEVTAFLFPAESLVYINMLSQFGLILFMYTIGMELDITEVKKKLQETILISHTSTIVPFFLGMLVAFFIYDNYAYSSTPFLSFALFIGIALSITAFPVLARIIQERGLTKTHLGTISLASAANGDITAWCLLAVVVSIGQAGSMLGAVYNILFSILYIALMLFVVRPILKLVGNLYNNTEVIDKPLVAMIFLLLLTSSYVTEILGLHALFGAFFAGMVMPENLKFRKIMNEKVEDVSLALFLPLFFASTGLRTEIGLLNTPDLWLLCGVFIIVAIIGKFGSAYFSSRFVGENVRDSLYMGALMNTRGLMELVVLTIGYEMGILTPAIFVMLVIMTLVTTFMTTPLISFINFCFRAKEKMQHKKHAINENVYKVLLSFGRAKSGRLLLNVANQMFSAGDKKFELTALHLTVGADVNPLQTENFEKMSFEPILSEARNLDLSIGTRYDVAVDAGEYICDLVNHEKYNFLLVGGGVATSNIPADMEAARLHRSLTKYFGGRKKRGLIFIPNSLIKDKTRDFIERSDSAVGVFVNRDFRIANKVLVLVRSMSDLVLLDYAKRLIRTTKGHVSVINLTPETDSSYDTIANAIVESTLMEEYIALLPATEIQAEQFSDFNFMLVGYETWNAISEEYNSQLMFMPSTLIIKHRDVL